ncbi:HlyD family secretion protein [Amaricoccus macauensis]|uniref:Membrane fusion protein (MFP) family protein n=1 Tax=Amaricoccus macauensis TaxID=57001 RepID=A0A840SUP0_9RHOB|nr:HlyD family type I secretion periplasmic adaptor subunit [Amaricoccus macauensis]MBB5224438.1 HlyD family secretion protein [Amaricoccus macauensis]
MKLPHMFSRSGPSRASQSGASQSKASPLADGQVETEAGPAPKTFDWSFRPFVLLGYATLAILVIGLGGWGVYARIAGAVIAAGTVEVEGNRQVVQHPMGGVVTEIFARDGDVVQKGDVILRLEGDTQRAEFQTVEGQYFELVARQNRLEALRDDKDSITFDEELVARSADELNLQELLTAQQGQFDASRDTLHKEQSQLDERSAQIEKQIEGLDFQLAATREQVDLTAQELAAQEKLMSQGLTQLTRVLSLRRDLAQLKGTQGAAQASVAENRAKITEIDLEKLKIENKQRDDAIAELREIEFREIELRSRRTALGEEISRLDIRAPVTGVVYGSAADTLRGVVRAAEPILYIVPQDVDLIVRTQIDAAKIDQVHVGQTATMHFSAFDARTTPVVAGKVSKVSADIFTDERTGHAYYRADVALDDTILAELEGRRLVPGMPVEAFISTEDRSALSYFVKPMADYFTRAFRER